MGLYRPKPRHIHTHTYIPGHTHTGSGMKGQLRLIQSQNVYNQVTSTGIADQTAVRARRKN